MAASSTRNGKAKGDRDRAADPVAVQERAGRVLPPVTVARMAEAVAYLTRLQDAETDAFAAAAERYTAARRSRSARTLRVDEATQVVGALGAITDDPASDFDDAVARVERVQSGPLRAHDAPPPVEVLLAAGLATAPAFLQGALRLVALLELDPDTFAMARENGGLEETIDAYVAHDLEYLPLDEARERAVAALEHFGRAAGAEPGETLALLFGTLWAAVQEGVAQIRSTPEATLRSSTASPAPTDGHASTSSTAPRT